MKPEENFITPLIERIEQYGKTSIELFKYKLLDKTTRLATTLVSQVVVATIFFLFVLTLTLAMALWIGDLTGKVHYGFLILAGFYALLAIIVFCLRTYIKRVINNRIIKQLLN